MTKTTQQSTDTFRDTTSFGVVHGEYDVTDWLTVFGSYGASYYKEIYNNGYTTNIISPNGDAETPTVPYSNRAVTESGLVGARVRFSTGPVSHTVSGDYERYESTGYAGFAFLGNSPTNIYQPLFRPIIPATGFNYNPPKSSLTTRSSFAVADTLGFFDDRVLFTAGVRQQTIDERNFETDGSTSSRYNKNRLSPGFGLVVKATERLSLYGNYIEQLNTGPTAPAGASNAGEIFPPSVAKQGEIGAKYNFDSYAVTAALFQITQQNGTLNSATNLFGIDGEQRNRGIEIKTFGEPIEHVRLLGGVAFIEGKQTKTADPANNGKTAVGVPVTNLSLGAEWDTSFARALTLTGRVIYTSKQYYDSANTQSIPGWARFDIGARYRFDRSPGKEPIIVRASVLNLFDNHYWQSTSRGFLSVGAPSTFLVSATVGL